MPASIKPREEGNGTESHYLGDISKVALGMLPPSPAFLKPKISHIAIKQAFGNVYEFKNCKNQIQVMRLLSDSRNNERQRLQRRQWKVHFSTRYSHSACPFSLNTLFFLARLQKRRILLIFQEFCGIYFPQQKLQKFFPERHVTGLEIGA